MSAENIIQIMPATGWVSVHDIEGDETAEGIVCFALVASATGHVVRPMIADGKSIVFADAMANFLRVEELAEFEEEEEDDEEDEEEEAEE